MARQDQAHPDNVAGGWFIDIRCVRCEAARHWAPGHTEGHVVYHIDNRWLFTGDTLFWDHRTDHLDVTPKQTWHSWAVLADSMDRIATLDVDWVFPGHGKWHNIGIQTYRAQMKDLGTDMRRTGQHEWAIRPHTVFSWYRGHLRGLAVSRCPALAKSETRRYRANGTVSAHDRFGDSTTSYSRWVRA